MSCVAECLMSYGAKAVLYQVMETPSCEDLEEEEQAKGLLEMAHTQLLHLQSRPWRVEEKLDETFNKVGATYRDMLQGDPIAPLRRKAEQIIGGEDVSLSESERMILNMYGASGGQTLGGKQETELAIASHFIKESPIVELHNPIPEIKKLEVYDPKEEA